MRLKALSPLGHSGLAHALIDPLPLGQEGRVFTAPLVAKSGDGKVRVELEVGLPRVLRLSSAAAQRRRRCQEKVRHGYVWIYFDRFAQPVRG